MKEAFKNWWDGTYVRPENPPGTAVFIIQGHYEKHWSSKLAHVIADFWLKYWQWCMGFGLAVAGIIWKH